MKKLFLSNWILCFLNQPRKVFCLFCSLIFMNFLGCSENPAKKIQCTTQHVPIVYGSSLVVGESRTIIIKTDCISDGMIKSIHINKPTTSKDYAHDFRLDDYQGSTFHKEIRLSLYIPNSVEEGRYVIKIEAVPSKDISHRVRLYGDLVVVKKSQLETEQYIQQSPVEQDVFKKRKFDFDVNTFKEEFLKSSPYKPFIPQKKKVPQGYNIQLYPLTIGISQLRYGEIFFKDDMLIFSGTISDINVTKKGDSDQKNYSDVFGISHYKNSLFNPSTRISFCLARDVDIATYILTMTVVNNQGQKNVVNIPLEIYSDAEEQRQQEQEQRYQEEQRYQKKAYAEAQKKAENKLQWLQELGFSPNDTPTKPEITKAFHRLAKIWHPDKSRGQFSDLTGEAFEQKTKELTEKFKKINEAHMGLTAKDANPTSVGEGAGV